MKFREPREKFRWHYAKKVWSELFENLRELQIAFLGKLGKLARKRNEPPSISCLFLSLSELFLLRCASTSVTWLVL